MTKYNLLNTVSMFVFVNRGVCSMSDAAVATDNEVIEAVASGISEEQAAILNDGGYGEGFEGYKDAHASGDMSADDWCIAILEEKDLTEEGYKAITGLEFSDLEKPEGWNEEAPDYGPSFSEYEEKWAASSIDEQTLLDAVKSGELTIAGFEFLAQEPYIDNKEPDNRSLVDKHKDSLTYRLGMAVQKPTTPITAINAYSIVQQDLDKGTLSETQAKELKDWLDVTVDNPMIREIKKHHVELTKLSDMQEAATNAAKGIVNQSVEIETSRLSKLVNAFADYAIFLMGQGRISPNAAMENDLWEQAKKDKLLGDPDPKNNQVKDDNDAVVAVTDLYSDPTIRSYRSQVCKAACLVCLESVSKVQFGYIPKDQVQGRRLNVRNVFQSAENINVPLEECLRDVCVPANILKPNISANIPDEIEKDGKMVKIYRLEVSRENPDASLRRLSKDHISALYAHHFSGEVLTYDVESETKIPTGYINGSKPKETATATTGATGTAPTTRTTRGSQTTEAATKEENKRLNEEVKNLKAIVASKVGDPYTTINALSAIFRDDTAEITELHKISFLRAFQAYIQRAKRSTKPLSESEASVLLDISADLSAVFEVTDDDGTCCAIFTAEFGDKPIASYKNPKVKIDAKGNENGETKPEQQVAA